MGPSSIGGWYVVAPASTVPVPLAAQPTSSSAVAFFQAFSFSAGFGIGLSASMCAAGRPLLTMVRRAGRELNVGSRGGGAMRRRVSAAPIVERSERTPTEAQRTAAYGAWMDF